MKDLSAAADWAARRSYPARRDPGTVAGLKNASVSVVLPARRVPGTLPAILESLIPHHRSGFIDELIVIVADPHDDTAGVARASGADVRPRDDILPGFGPSLGKGDALWRGVSVTSGDIVAFFDTDTQDFNEHFLFSMLAPLFEHPDLTFVKGSFRRPLSMGDNRPEVEGGRVTELMARPLLNLHEPGLAGFVQPLAGEVAARRSLLEAIPFAAGYGVEIGMLIDAYRSLGLDALSQADLLSRSDSKQSLRDLSAMAYGVLAAVSKRCGLEPPPELLLARPGELSRIEVMIQERPPLGSL
ncbi:MAG: glucosyl-3-phosphoglycerate synthase [Actinomycetota bacterium]